MNNDLSLGGVAELKAHALRLHEALIEVIRNIEAVSVDTPQTKDGFEKSRELFPFDPIARGLVFEPDVYRSVEPEDVELFERHAQGALRSVKGAFVDFLGRITRCTFLPSIAHLDGRASNAVPVPGDGFYADGIEYVGLLRALERVSSSFTVVELGAGWGPWIAAAGVAAKRKSLDAINLIGVEASKGKIEMMKEHLVDNGLRPDVPDPETWLKNLHCITKFGAIWTEDGEVFFPSVVADQDYGGTVAAEDRTSDYRKLSIEHTAVPAFKLESLLSAYPLIDFMHIDIQGAEGRICKSSIAFLKERCRYIFIGTHSRSIEGELITLFKSNGFRIIREKPCRFSLDHWTGELEGITFADGGQLWVNEALA